MQPLSEVFVQTKLLERRCKEVLMAISMTNRDERSEKNTAAPTTTKIRYECHGLREDERSEKNTAAPTITKIRYECHGLREEK